MAQNCARHLAFNLLLPGGMLKARQQPSAVGTVLVVSSNAETLDALHEYFNQTGIASLGRGVLNPLAEVPPQIHALVMFPDDFSPHEAAAYLSMLRARRPDLTIVVITREPPVYATMIAIDGHPLRATVLPRPAFGWAIVDALRSPA